MPGGKQPHIRSKLSSQAGVLHMLDMYERREKRQRSDRTTVFQPLEARPAGQLSPSAPRPGLVLHS